MRASPYADHVTRRRGAFPGSFNPLTIAHLELSQRARDDHDLDEVHLIVSEVALDKPSPPGPPFAERIAILEADAAEYDWLHVATTDQKLIVDIAQGFDVVIMGADKWHQVNDVKYYADSTERDDAVARLPQVVVAARTGTTVPDEFLLETDDSFHDVSSTAARSGDRDTMAPQAALRWHSYDGHPGFVGWWECVHHTMNGSTVNVEHVIEQIHADGTFDVYFEGKRIGGGRHVEFIEDPNGFTNLQEGTDELANSGPHLVLYRLSQDTLEYCKAPESDGRPTEFASPKGSGWIYGAMKRIDDTDPRVLAARLKGSDPKS